MDKIKTEIENILIKYLSKTNLDRITQNKNEYKIFILTVLNYILEVKYQDLVNYLKDNIIDSQKNIEDYSNYLLDLYFGNSYDKMEINEKNQKVIFWDNNGFMNQYITLYPIASLIRYNNNIIIFYKNQNKNNMPLAELVSKIGNTLLIINFPTKKDNECVTQNISYNGANIFNKKKVIQVVFVGGACRLDFWCKYDLDKKKYIESNLWK